MAALNVRIEEKTKRAASKVLSDIGLDLSTGVKIFLRQVIVEKGLPFTPSKNPAVLRVEWDREIAEARKNKRFKSVDEILKGL